MSMLESTNGLPSVQHPSDFAARGPRARVIYEYDVPPDLVGTSSGITVIGLVELTANDELMAANRANGQAVQLAYELSKESLRLVARGAVRQAVSSSDGTSDLVWSQISAPLRSLVLQAYAEIHTPKARDTASFLASRRVTAG